MKVAASKGRGRGRGRGRGKKVEQDAVTEKETKVDKTKSGNETKGDKTVAVEKKDEEVKRPKKPAKTDQNVEKKDEEVKRSKKPAKTDQKVEEKDEEVKRSKKPAKTDQKVEKEAKATAKARPGARKRPAAAVPKAAADEKPKAKKQKKEEEPSEIGEKGEKIPPATWGGRWIPTDPIQKDKIMAIKKVFEELISPKVKCQSSLAPKFCTACNVAFVSQGLSEKSTFDEYVGVAEQQVKTFFAQDFVRPFH